MTEPPALSDSMVCLRYAGLTLQVVAADRAALLWLEEFLSPSFQRIESESADVRVQLTVDDQRYDELLRVGPPPDATEAMCFVLETGGVRLPLWQGAADRRVIFDARFKVFYLVTADAGTVEVLSATRNLSARPALMRVVREFVMTRSRTGGKLAIHGAALTVGGQGILIAGPKRAGKTSLLIYCLRGRDARYVTNDRVVIAFDGHSPVLRGMPTFVTIRDEALDLFAELRPLLERRPEHRRALAELRDDPGPFRPRGRPVDLSPAQFCELLQVPMHGHSRVDVLLFPSLTENGEGIRVEALAPACAADRLGAAWFGRGGGVSDVFVAPPDRHRSPRNYGAAVCQALVSRVPCFECHLGREAYHDAAALTGFLRRILSPRDGEPSGAGAGT